MAERVKKRDGSVEKFDRKKLLKSIHVSMQRKNNPHLEEKITNDVMKQLKKKTVSVENIRSAVCVVLRKNKHHEVCDFYSMVWLHAKPVKIRYVIKRNGKKEKFSPEKLFKSVQKSFKSAHEEGGLEAVMKEVLERLNKHHKGKDVESSEIKDMVEYVLVKRKLLNVSKHYIVYRYM